MNDFETRSVKLFASITKGKTMADEQYPEGKLTEDDEGALTTAISVVNGNVKIDFGKHVAWVAFPPQMAADFASIIIKHAKRAAREKGVFIQIRIE